jgi:hypothetical protein
MEGIALAFGVEVGYLHRDSLAHGLRARIGHDEP